MRNYTTQMDAARKGILTPEIKTVAEKEHMETDKLMNRDAESDERRQHGCRDHHGSFQPWRYTAVPSQTDF